MRIVCQQTILLKYHGLFVIFDKAAKFEIVVCCKIEMALYDLRAVPYDWKNLVSTLHDFTRMFTIFILHLRKCVMGALPMVVVLIWWV